MNPSYINISTSCQVAAWRGLFILIAIDWCENVGTLLPLLNRDTDTALVGVIKMQENVTLVVENLRILAGV